MRPADHRQRPRFVDAVAGVLEARRDALKRAARFADALLFDCAADSRRVARRAFRPTSCGERRFKLGRAVARERHAYDRGPRWALQDQRRILVAHHFPARADRRFRRCVGALQEVSRAVLAARVGRAHLAHGGVVSLSRRPADRDVHDAVAVEVAVAGDAWPPGCGQRVAGGRRLCVAQCFVTAGPLRGELRPEPTRLAVVVGRRRALLRARWPVYALGALRLLVALVARVAGAALAHTRVRTELHLGPAPGADMGGLGYVGARVSTQGAVADVETTRPAIQTLRLYQRTDVTGTGRRGRLARSASARGHCLVAVDGLVDPCDDVACRALQLQRLRLVGNATEGDILRPAALALATFSVLVARATAHADLAALAGEPRRAGASPRSRTSAAATARAARRAAVLVDFDPHLRPSAVAAGGRRGPFLRGRRVDTRGARRSRRTFFASGAIDRRHAIGRLGPGRLPHLP